MVNPNSSETIFVGDSEMAILMRARFACAEGNTDWSQTLLGSVSEWSQSLKTSVSILLNSRYPMFVWWGREYANLYNDAYRPILGSKHPQFLGQSARDCWADVWNVVGPLAESVVATGQPTWSENLLLLMERNDYTEETYFTFSYSPIRDERNEVGGIFCAVIETTQQIIGERRLQTLRELSANTAEAKTVEEACHLATTTLSANPHDIPFALLYLVDVKTQQANLATTTTNITAGIPASPQQVDLTQAIDDWHLTEVHQTGTPVLINNLTERFGQLPGGAWSDSPNAALVMPIAKAGQEHQRTGFLIMGISPRREFDDDYRGFFDLVANQVARAIAGADAYEAARKRAEVLAEEANLKLAQLRREATQREQALRLDAEAAQQKVEMILSSISDGVYTLDRHWCFTYANDRVCKMAGKSREELLGHRSWDLFPEAVDTVAYTEMQRAMRDQTIVQFEYLDPHQDRWFEHRVYPSRDGLTVFVAEITHRRQTELLQVEQQRLLEMIATGHPLDDCLSAMGEAIATLHPGTRTCFLLADAQRATFPRSITPNLPPSFGAGLKDAAINELCIGTGQIYAICGISTDITDRKQAEATIRQSEEQLRLASEGAKLGLWHWDVQSDILTWTDQCKALFGLPVDTQMSYQVFLDALHPEDRQRIQEMRPCWKLDNWSDMKLNIERFGPDGTVRWLAARGQATYNANGTPISSMGVVFDITDRKQAEAALRESEARFRGVVESNMVGILFWDASGCITDGNEMAVQMLGYSQEELQSRQVRWIDITPPEFQEIDNAMQAQLLTEGVCSPFEKAYIRKDGTQVPILIGGALLPGYGDRGVAYFLDITDRKRRELNANFLANITQDLTCSAHVDDLFQTTGEKICGYFGFSILTFSEVDDIADRSQIIYNTRRSGVPDANGDHRLADYLNNNQIEQLKAGRVVAIDDVSALDIDKGDAAYQPFQARSTLVAPYISNGRLQFLLAGSRNSPSQWRTDEIDLMQELAARIWIRIERARAEAALRQSEERYRTLFESIDEGFCIIEMLFDENNAPVDYRFLEINPVFEQQTGLQQAVGKTARQLVPDLEDFWFETYGRVALTGEPIRFENRSAPMNRWFDVYACRIGEPEARKVAIVFKDISDRKAVEDILRRDVNLSAFRVSLTDTLRPLADPIEVQATTSRLLGEYLGANRVAYFEVRDADYVVERDYVNGATALVGKYPIDSFGQELLAAYRTGRPVCVSDVAADPNLTTDQQSAYAAIQIGAHIGVPLIRQGELVAGLAVHTVRPRAWTPDEVALVQEVAERIWSALERTRIEANLRRSEAEFRIISNAAPALVWVGAQDGSIIFFNDRWYEFTGQTEAEALGFGWTNIMHPDDTARILPYWEHCRQTGNPYEGEVRYRRHDGEYCWYAFRALPRWNEAGEIEAWYGLSVDISDRVQLERDRERILQREQAAREAAEAASRIKDEFLAVVSHELRSPLNPILGWSKLLRSRQLDEQKTIRALEVIERNAQMQAQLINDLLDVSRILRGKLSLDTQPVDLVTTIQAAMETVRLAAEAKSIQINTEFEPDVGQVAGDAGRLQQVIWNLLTNAVKFTSEGGRVDIRLEGINSQAQITITDTGKGIPPDFLPYVFEQFRQESSATTRRFGGLGLGLAIVRYLVELHGGTVQADSLGEGQGATFTVKLPLMPHQPITQPDSKPSEFSLNLQGTRILIVDDDDNTREFLAFLLELHGANVIATATAGEALTTLTQFKPDVLLSDIGMPDVDGYMLMRQVRALPPKQGGTIPAIALTAYAGEIDYRQAMAAGFQQHIAKPIEPEVLIQAIATLLGQTAPT